MTNEIQTAQAAIRAMDEAERKYADGDLSQGAKDNIILEAADDLRDYGRSISKAAGAPEAQQPLYGSANMTGVATGSRNDSASESVTPGSLPPQSLTEYLQTKCSNWGTYWRASDAHGVNLTIKQAHELLCDALGVEVEITASIAAIRALPSGEPVAYMDEDGAIVSAWRKQDSAGTGNDIDTFYKTPLYTTPPVVEVTETMVERGLQAAIDASDARLPRYSVVRAILTAALKEAT